MNAAPSPQAAMEMDTQQKETDSDLNQQPILRSASLTCILDELSEQADHKRGKSTEYYGLVEVGSSGYDNADASEHISSIMVEEKGLGNVLPSPLADDRTTEISVDSTELVTSTAIPSSSYIQTSSSSSSHSSFSPLISHWNCQAPCCSTPGPVGISL